VTSKASEIERDGEERFRPRPESPRSRALATLGSSRYSSFVNAMKVVLPAVALGIILLVVAWPQFRAQKEGFHLGIANLSRNDVENLRMVHPRYQGLDKRGEPFTVTALTAIKRKPTSDVVELDTPQADITLNRGNWVTLKADFGAYREQDQQLDLIGKVSLYQDEGYEFHTLSARIDMANNTATGDDPVQGQGPFGDVTSQGFRILDKGARVIFTGKAHLTLRPKATDGAEHG